MPWLAGATLAAPIISGLIGQSQGQGARDAAEADSKRALEQYANIPLPDIEQMKLALQNYQVTGKLDPAMENASLLGDTSLKNIQQDPKYNQYTMSALQKMADVSQNGLPDADRAQLQQILNQSANQNEAAQKQILENRAARGMGGSGDELAAQLSAAQQSANSASNNSMQLAALAAQRKLDATSNLGAMVNTAQNADYQRQRDLQSQRDAFAQFNAQQQQGVTQRNVGAMNSAQAANLQNQQNISNANVDLSNQQQQFNKGLTETNFQNQIQKAGGTAAQYNNMANVNTNNANATGAMWGNIGSGLVKAGTAYMGANKPSATTPTTTATTENDPVLTAKWNNAINNFGQS